MPEKTPMEVNVRIRLITRERSVLLSNTFITLFDTYIVFLCTAETSWLDNKHVVFGKVVSGQDVVSAIEQVGSDSGRTRVAVVISDCGQLR